MRRLVAAVLVACAGAAFITACGSSGPTPTPNPGGGPPPVINGAPEIKSVTPSSASAEVGTPVTVTAIVEDAETPVANLIYEWKADTGTFTGTAGIVTWVAGQDAKTPADVVLTLTVTERYTSGSISVENKATSTTSVHLNNSPKELVELSLRFLGDFATSSVSAEKCVAEFSDSCSGKADELTDISNNRHDFQILKSTLRHTGIDLPPSRLTATVHTFCAFTSRVITQNPRSEGCLNTPGACPFNADMSVEGDCVTTNVYEKGRWWLCQSNFKGQELTALQRAFFGMRRPEIP